MSFMESCELSADILSCEAQTHLAKQEIQRNAYIHQYNTIHPICSRLNQLSDREIEYLLQKSQSTSLKTCYTRPLEDLSQGGQWKDQFQSLLPHVIGFDQVTKARFNTPRT